MTALLDDLGIWQQLGTITPNSNWQTFPVQASSIGNTFRLAWGGDMSDVKSFVYLRSVFQLTGQQVVSSRWKRAYPKSEREVIELPLSLEFALQNLGQYFQVIKKYKYEPLGYTVTDSSYSLTLEEFIPYPETIKQIQNQPAIKEAVREVLAEGNIIPLPPGTELPPPPP